MKRLSPLNKLSKSMSMSTLGWRLMLLVVAARAFPDLSSPYSETHERHKRQGVPPEWSDAELLCRLNASLSGDICDEIFSSSPNSPVEANCICAPVWQCTDTQGPSGE